MRLLQKSSKKGRLENAVYFGLKESRTLQYTPFKENAFKKHVVHLTIRCSVVFTLKQCGFLSDAEYTTIWVSRKRECPRFGKFKIALKP